jgi:hypothetical protein
MRLQQFHDVGRTEEVQAQHLLRTASSGGNGVDIQRRRITRQNRFGFEQTVQFAEDFLFQFEVFVYRFDHQIDLADRCVIRRCGHSRSTRIGLSLIDTALSHIVSVGFGHRGQRLFKHLRIVIHPLHRHPGVGQAHDNATAHGARPDDGGALNIEWRLAHDLLSCWRSKDSPHHSQPS